MNRESALKKQSEEEKTSLKQSVDKSSALITERDKELQKLRDEVKCHILNSRVLFLFFCLFAALAS